MKNLALLLLFFTVSLYSQNDILKTQPSNNRGSVQIDTLKKPSITLYKIYNIAKDTTYVDTTLSIQKEYKFNYLRKDNFGLLAFSNEGQTYNTLDFNLQSKSNSVNFGFNAKHFAYQEVQDINYYEVPTPLTDLYYKSVMTQGQNLDAFLTVNTKPNLNLFIGYKGLRSNGKFINNLSSTGNFKIGGTYFTLNKKYNLNFHFTSQDITNQENGGIVNKENFESGDAPFTQRERLEVFFEDATSLLKGSRYFINQSYNLSQSAESNSSVFHQFNYEYKQFFYDQYIANDRFGTSFKNVISDNSKLKTLSNTVGYSFQNINYGNITFSGQHINYNSYYSNVVYNSNGTISVPNQIKDNLIFAKASYQKQFNSFLFTGSYNQSIDGSGIRDLLLNAKYNFTDQTKISVSYLQNASLPNLNYTLLQSSYANYNWFNSFKNEQTHTLLANLETPFVNLVFNAKNLSNHLYFANTATNSEELLIKPFQYSENINYVSLEANKEFKYKKWAFDNRFLFQQVDQNNPIINVPDLLFRSTVYYTDFVFKNAMEIQIGLSGQYFTSYFANNYNPVLGEFYVQNITKIGNFPLMDFFINAKVRQTRFFIKAEHFNSSFTGYNYYSAPDYPYRDFIVRFGLVWNFFL